MQIHVAIRMIWNVRDILPCSFKTVVICSLVPNVARDFVTFKKLKARKCTLCLLSDRYDGRIYFLRSLC